MGMLVIGKLISNNEIKQYKIFDTNTKSSRIMDASTFAKKIRVIGSINYTIKDGHIIEKNEQDNKYPIFSIEQSKLLKNSIIIIGRSGQKYSVTDYNGTIREVTLEQLATCDRSKLANDLSFPEIATYKPQAKQTNSTKTDNESTTNKLIDFDDISKSILSEFIDADNASTLNYNKQRFKRIKEGLSGEIKVNEITRLEPKVEEPKVKDIKVETEVPEVGNIETTESKSSTPEIGKPSVDDAKEYTLKIRDTEGGIKEVYGIIPADYTGTVEIPEGVTHIDERCFSNYKITGILLPSTLRYIGDYAFHGTNITSVKLPKSIDTIPHGCFGHCSYLVEINLEHINTIGNYAFADTDIENVKIDSDLAQVGIAAFMNCKNLKSFKHNNTIKKIRKSAFENCVSLDNFDFTGINDVEEKAFSCTGLKTISLGPEVTYIMPYTFTSNDLTEVNIEVGGYKIGNHAFENSNGGSVTYTLSKDITNIGTRLFTDKDTVRCYHGSVAEAMAREADAKIEYLDEKNGIGSKAILKARMIGADVEELISELISKCYNKDDTEYSYEMDENGLYSVGLTPEIIKYLGIDSRNTPDEYEEKPKFKILLDHYRKACKFYAFPLTNKMMSLKDTFSISNNVIYDDGVSRILEFLFEDHKYESIKSKLIVAITGNNVRYACLNNRLTDLYCRATESKDLKRLLEVMVPGDIIGYECTLGGIKYKGIKGRGDCKKNNQVLPVNLYQALFRCAITIKLEKNFIAMILPANNKVIYCATIGGSVWANETESAHKERKCSIVDIQDLDKCTLFNYGAKSPSRDDILFNKIKSLSNDQILNRIKEYSHIGKSVISPYTAFRNYCIVNGVKKLEELNYDGFSILMKFPIIEERTDDWLDNSIGRTIVDYSRNRVDFNDGSSVNQYKTMKRVAMRNKLLTGGDREIYVYELCDVFGVRSGIYACNMDLQALFDMAISMNVTSKDSQKIYQDTTHFDLVPVDDMILIAEAFVSVQDRQKDMKARSSNVWLTVYKPNGLYYISYITFYGKSKKVAIPLIQVGELDVVTDYIDCATTKSSEGFKLISNAGAHENYLRMNEATLYWRKRESEEYDKLLKARKLAISGVTNTERYLDIGIPPVIAHMFGTHNYGDSLYSIPEKEDIVGMPDDEEISLDMGDIDLGEHQENESNDTTNDDITFDVNEDDLELSEEELAGLGYDTSGIDDEEDLSDSSPEDEADRVRKLLQGQN